MSYNDGQRGYGESDRREYGGGGQSGDNYYDQSKRFDDGDQRGGHEGSEIYGGGRRTDFDGGDQERLGERVEYGRRQEHIEGSDVHGGRQGDDYGGERLLGRRQDGGYGNSSGDTYERYGRVDDDRRPDRRHDEGYGGSTESYGDGGGSAGFDQDEVLRHARQHGSSGEFDLFSTAMSFLGNNKQSAQQENFDQRRVQQSHQQLYQDGGGQQEHDASSLGAGAAMQALKMFSGTGSQSPSGGQSQMISLAMQEASKLFDTQNGQGNVASGTDKQSVINQAAKVALQMYLKSQTGASAGGSGAGGLMNLASKLFN